MWSDRTLTSAGQSIQPRAMMKENRRFFEGSAESAHGRHRLDASLVNGRLPSWEESSIRGRRLFQRPATTSSPLSLKKIESEIHHHVPRSCRLLRGSETFWLQSVS